MRPLYRNLFLLFGIVSVIIMMYGFGVDFTDLHQRIARVGLYLPAVVGIWVFVYAFNAGAFYEIVNSGNHDKHLSYLHAYKLTVSGFAFSYTTPFGFGGAPYRVMELSSYIGTPRAMSCTVLYSMMHILSHFFLWMTGVIMFIILYFDKMNPLFAALFAIFTLVFCIVIYFFYYGYKNGMIVKLYGILLHIPFVKKYAKKFYEKNIESMKQVDQNIAYLHSQPHAFYSALVMEYVGRVINSYEYYFILLSLGFPVSFGDALLVLAFSSLIGNVLFFFPMQLGAREGSLAFIVKLLGFGTLSIGLFASFYTRIRELFWIIVGVSLVKVGTKKIMK
ncbi:lysylphosphatidylglycerol synthase transmembrane domain-containing protein [uncultured Alloprevotella sp.]|jgi:putative membrane protein|uniref:lysylphosphatidylglycerol synthase transmembrane domain-containing protein n=1 Tax=uncultured Alloprevotella sp. TaxID=1283315 RepID=UPI00325FD018